ncbi:phage integrase N-terminal domain-containing protein [Lentibacillus cibarius]|uniref:Tyr recombinase domain-containing protein n=1 Tax=Lentibacillus cibarius TaxID=2583219 RepID=A0A5S3QFJ7_9BACI|nr:phage integrase N-terminal domain-containing protein [Lentibacillus cibarius]TMN18809.1 hypothetical protein FFL34_17820 [Lentibacillus cibarius]TMN18837.1 hypothetical protein FFL34_17985 [Lentibacillus cibarius]
MAKGKSPIQAQADKLFKHTRSGSYGTRARYQGSCKQFLQFVHEEFKMKNLRNLQDKHVVAFIHARQDAGITTKTIKNDLGAIRYLHDMVPNAKHELTSNDELERQHGIELETEAKGDRSWTNEEYNNMYAFADEQSKEGGAEQRTACDVRDTFVLSRTMGLRVAEAVAMHRSQAENALRTGVYQVKNEAKNGKHRQVPLSSEAREMLTERLQSVERGEKIFVQPTEKTHRAINRIEKYLGRHRNKFETQEGRERRSHEGGYNRLTFHGLRYNYVQDRLNWEMLHGRNFRHAAKIITKEVGHNRLEVINVYLGKK